ncbi:MAG: biopolymer transporter Tol [Acidobacteriota bacterium]|nr:biopolymer transporter Tol [Acidobacteriota bacterium]
MVRASLDDDAPEAFIGLHGAGMIQLALRPTRGAPVTDLEYRINSRGMVAGPTTGGLATLTAQRIGLRKHGESFSLYVSVSGEPMHAFGPPIHLALPGPYYVGIGFCSHLPATVDSARFSNVMLMHGPAEPR